MLQYKENLGVLNHRYTETERQLLRTFLKKHRIITERKMQHMFTPLRGVSNAFLQFGGIQIHQSMWWMIGNLLDDELVEMDANWPGLEENVTVALKLTPKGNLFVTRWSTAQPL